MKNPKRLTRDQKFILSRNNLDAKDFGLLSETEDSLILLSKIDQSTVTVYKKKQKRIKKINE